MQSMVVGCRLWVESAVPIQCIGVVLLTKISYVVPEQKSSLFSLSAEEGREEGQSYQKAIRYSFKKNNKMARYAPKIDVLKALFAISGNQCAFPPWMSSTISESKKSIHWPNMPYLSSNAWWRNIQRKSVR